MRSTAPKTLTHLPAAPAKTKLPGRSRPDAGRAAGSIFSMQHSAGNQAVERLLKKQGASASANPQVYTRRGKKVIAFEEHQSWPLADKSVDGNSDSRFGLVEDKDPPTGSGSAAKPTAPAPVKKKAGIDSFEVKWAKNSAAGPANARLRLDYKVKFKKDANFDPAVAEFRQNAFHLFEVSAGPHKGSKHNNDPLHDDNYSRADDLGGNAKDDVDFVSNDNPGTDSIAADDVIDYSFTAEQMIIDTSDGNKEVAKRGPNTATIKGKDPRAYDGVPKTFS